MDTIAIILGCLLINAVLSAIEMAFVSLSLPQLKSLARSGDTIAAKLLKYRENPERALSVLQVGITLVGAISAAAGGAGAEEILRPIFENTFKLREDIATALAVGVVVLPLTYVSVVIGELVPKILALRHPLLIAKLGARVLHLLNYLFAPFVWLLEKSTKLITKPIRIRHDHNQRKIEEVNIEQLTHHHRQYVINLVDLENKRIRDIMVPWNQVNIIHVTQTMQKVAEIILQSGHTRLPVVDDQNVIGVLHTKEFMSYREAGASDWTSIVRPILKVRETESLIRALRMMQISRRHMSLVISKDDVLIGIITLEDIIEEIVGDIYDEDDDGSVRSILASKAALKFRGKKEG